MKLIRDIISEKRQMASHAVQPPEPATLGNHTDEAALMQDAITRADDTAFEAPSDAPAEDEFANFFAENDDPFALEADDVVEPPQTEDREDRHTQGIEDAPVDRPSKLVLGKAYALDPEKDQISQPGNFAEFENESPRIDTPAAAPVEEQDPAQSLKDVFRELNTAPEPAPEAEPESDPASDAEQHVAELLDLDAGAEPQEEHGEPPLPQPEIQRAAPAAVPASKPAPAPAPTVNSAPDSVEVPKPALGRGMSRHGRVKTRLLGFNTSMNDEIDPMKGSNEAKPAAYTTFPVGWLIVVEGEGRGSAFSLFNGVSNIGRGTDQTVCLDFGDNSISRDAHASIAYDPRQQSFFIGHCGKANIVRRNDRPILSTEELAAGDHITIGETVLRFVPLCGPDFSWESANSAQAHAANG